MNTPSSAGFTLLLSTEKLPSPSRLRSVITENARQIGASLLIALTLSIVMAGLLPAFSTFWSFAIGQLMSPLALEARLAHAHGLVPFLEATAALNPGDPLKHIGAALALVLIARLGFKAPLRRILSAVGGIHLLNTLLVCYVPGAFPYTLGEHTQWLSLFNVGLILALPLIMLVTHAIIERSLERRILATVLICAYFILVLPAKLVAHAALILWLGKPALPTLFIFLGPAFDILLFTTLYAYVVTWRHGNG